MPQLVAGLGKMLEAGVLVSERPRPAHPRAGRQEDAEREQVVQANGVTTEEEYRRVSRVGQKRVLCGPPRPTRQFLSISGQALDYASVIVDEAQDMGAQSFRLIRNIVAEDADDLCVVCDGHQRIYGRNKVVLGRCGINICGRSRKLRLNYRTTEETRHWATRLVRTRRVAGCRARFWRRGFRDERRRAACHRTPC